MGDKKKYIAIVVFILLGLSIFAFAGSDDELEDKTQNGDKQQEVSGNKDTDNKKDEVKDEVVNNNKVNNTTNNKVNTTNNNTTENNNNNNTNENNSETSTDNSYELALEAVKKLENTLTNNDYESANELVSKVTDTSKKEELEGRVNNAKKSIDAIALVEELEGIYNNDLTIKNLTNSRTFKTSKNVEETIALVENNEVKENLLSRILKLNRTLNDTTSPVVTGIPESGLTNKDVTLEVTDATNVTKKVLLNGQETNEFANTNTYNLDGKYEITYIDEAFNETKVEFTIDKTAPEVLSIIKSNKDKSTNKDVIVTIKFNEGVNAPEGWTKISETEYSKVYSENGKNTIRFTDYAGNIVDVFFEVKRIDKVAPNAIVETSNNGLPTNQDVIVTITANEAIYKPTGWTEVVTNKEHTFTKVYTENGDYSVEITDKAGNKSTIDFKVEGIDRIPATISVSGGTIGNNPYSKLNLKIYDASGVAKVVINGNTLPHTGKYVDINDGHAYTFIEGENVVEVTDKAGNVTTETFIKDTIAPVLKAHSLVGKDPYYSQISFKLSDNYAIDYFVLNGVKYDRTDAKWSDANYQNIKKDLKDGENTIILYDVAGNSTEYKFELDLVKPTITIKDTSESKNNIYTNISFKLSDDHLIDKFVVNGKTFDVTDNMWGDANFDAIKGSLKEGTNTITLYDVAGNSTELEFEYTEYTLVMTFEDLQEAFKKGGKIKLLNDITSNIQLRVEPGTTIILDMNGKKLTASDNFTLNKSGFAVLINVRKDGTSADCKKGTLVITGNGTFDVGNTKGMAIFPGGNVTIENGTFLRKRSETASNVELIGGVGSSGAGTLKIYDGYFDGGYYKEGETRLNSITNVNISKNKVEVYGGTFVGQNVGLGDEGNGNQGYFLVGQTASGILPDGYTITTGTLSDGRPTYTVHYNK